MKIAVWLARLVLGATFMLSGLTKMVDPLGSMTKIEAYLQAWGLADMFAPGVVLVGGCALSMAEFIVGFLLLTGSLRRSAAWLGGAIMAFMLPLSAYIALANPVDDCGCFGDFLVISNTATFLKNIVLTALAFFLCRYNRRAGCLFAPWIQWAQIAVAVAYMLVLGIIGYHEQPLLDFRPYPVGEPLTDSEGARTVYIYERDGTRREFTADELPGDDLGWEFVDVRNVAPASGKMLALIDRESGEDVTDEALAAAPCQILLLVPEPSDASAAGSFTANELKAEMERRYGPGSFLAVTAADSAAVARAMDLMMADYPVYYADPKAIKTVARGAMAAVCLENDTVRWKRTLSSINLDLIGREGFDMPEAYATHGPSRFRLITLLALAAEIIVALIGTLSALRRRLQTLKH